MFRRAYLAESNDAMARMYGYESASQIAGWRLPRFHDPENPGSRDFLKGFIRNGYRLTDAESREPDRDGVERIFMNSFVGQVEDGKLLRAWGMQRDVTEQRKAQEALGKSEAAFRELADAMPQIVFAARPDGTVDYFNRQWYEYTGLPNGEMGFEHWKQAHTEEGLRRVMEVWPEALRTGEPYEIEYQLRRHDGAYRWHLGRARPVKDADGKIIRWFGTNTDIHDHKMLQEFNEQLLESERAARIEAERASESKSAFLATLSHELRTPLTPVLLTVSLMESHPGLPQELRDDVATIRRNVELESRLISDLLDLTRVARGKLQLDMQDVDLHLIIRSAIDICQREASAKMVVDLKAMRHTVRGDSTRLQQVFWNLINNAIKFTSPEGTITVRSSDAANGLVRVEIVDTGVGIDPAVLPKLFNAFEQGEVRVVRQQAGLGLGLAISRKLAEAHGGTIRAASPGKGRGSTFTVDLPAVDSFAPVAVAPPAAAAPEARRVLNVLLIEDHEATLGVMTKLLRGMGHKVTATASVGAALAAARQDSFDLIISDLGLPDGSGLDVMRSLRGKYQGRAIALTGYGMESDIADSQAAGFAEHLTKPVDVSELEAAINRVTAGEKS